MSVWTVITKAHVDEGLYEIVVKPTEGQEVTHEEWAAVRTAIEKAIKPWGEKGPHHDVYGGP